MDGDQEPAEGAGAGDGKTKRVAITEKMQAASMMGFFHSLPPGTKATAVPPPPGPKASAQTQSDYHNAQWVAYDSTTPVRVQMVLSEIGEQAAESELSGCSRGALAMARGMVTGSRANSPTSGASIWAPLLSQSAGSSPAAKRPAQNCITLYLVSLDEPLLPATSSLTRNTRNT